MADYLKKEINDTDVLCQEVLGMPVQGSDQQVTIDATAGGNNNTTAFTLGRQYSFRATEDCYLAFGTDSVTITAGENYYLPADQEVIFTATQEYCAVIRVSADGTLFINLLDGGAN